MKILTDGRYYTDDIIASYLKTIKKYVDTLEKAHRLLLIHAVFKRSSPDVLCHILNTLPEILKLPFCKMPPLVALERETIIRGHKKLDIVLREDKEKV